MEVLDWAAMSPDPPVHDPNWTESWGRQGSPEEATEEVLDWAAMSPDPPVHDPNWTESWGRQGAPEKTAVPEAPPRPRSAPEGKREQAPPKDQGGDPGRRQEVPARNRHRPKPCPACGVQHPLRECQVFKTAERGERHRLANKAKVCGRCLHPGHYARDCNRTSTCQIAECGGRHHPLLH